MMKTAHGYAPQKVAFHHLADAIRRQTTLGRYTWLQQEGRDTAMKLQGQFIPQHVTSIVLDICKADMIKSKMNETVGMIKSKMNQTLEGSLWKETII